ncbi:hypothetical protein CEV31_3538 [Brucella thiophenivorans]|uniref:Uncharacterized protein n=1 Tax=Brucella thiophenivorans TaxID=571255 RepID=A0A256FED1_9HYPH|nr:hypothetical protein CEV31_3538 [Brucella thiophenivorans]
MEVEQFRKIYAPSTGVATEGERAAVKARASKIVVSSCKAVAV